LPTSTPPASDEAARRAFEGKFARARQLILAGNAVAARALNDELLAERPDHCGALIQRSRLESDEDNYGLAREYTLSAFRSGATNKRQCLLLLRRLRLFNLIPELRQFLEGLSPEFMADADIALSAVKSYELINDPDSVLRIAAHVSKDGFSSADLEASVGHAMLNLGRFEEAEKRFQASLVLDPGHAAAWWHLSRLRKHTVDHNHIDQLREKLSDSDNPHRTALLGFALHRELDDLEDYAAAAQALDLACSSMRKVVDYDAKEDERLFAALQALPTEATQDAATNEDPSFTPVFIVGMHRSGTTLLEHLLAGHGDVSPGGELQDFPAQLRLAADHHSASEVDLRIIEASNQFDFAAIGKGYLDNVEWRSNGRRFVTDKLASNFLNLGFILRALPHAKILHMSRDPMETCFSNLREPFSQSACRYSYDQVELAGYYRQYYALMRHWRKRFPGRIHDVTYTSLATDPAAELKRVTSYLGIEFQASMLDTGAGNRSVNTASAVQVRQKPGLPLRPKWQPYREYLTPLSWRLSEVGQRY
jgi:tetratricopeptide (TPR) repeat protein